MLKNKETRGEPSPICAQSIIPIDISKLVPFHSNPFIRENDPTINELVCSIRNCGIITPLEVRPIVNDQYQIISGYRRYKAALICGLDVVPSLILDQTEDEAIIHMIDCNIQRENILPSEKAFAYKLKLEAIKRIKQNKKIAPKISARYRSDDDLGLIYGVSGDTVRNYILLTRLHPDLLKMVDEKDKLEGCTSCTSVQQALISVYFYKKLMENPQNPRILGVLYYCQYRRIYSNWNEYPHQVT